VPEGLREPCLPPERKERKRLHSRRLFCVLDRFNLPDGKCPALDKYRIAPRQA